MKIRFRPEAFAEVAEARDWYESRSPGLGFDFARALEAALASAARSPGTYPFVDGECRRVLLRRFPYSLIYVMAKDTLLVVAVFHSRREPRSWAGRLGG